MQKWHLKGHGPLQCVRICDEMFNKMFTDVQEETRMDINQRSPYSNAKGRYAEMAFAEAWNVPGGYIEAEKRK